MATDREAARRQRLRGAQTRDVVDADTSFGFRLPGPSSTVIAESITVGGQIATPTPAANTRRGGRQGLGGTKRSSPSADENSIPDITAGPQDGSTTIAAQIDQAAKRQRRAAPADDPASRAAGRNQRLRGAQLRSPGVSTQDFGFRLPEATSAPSVTTTDTDLVHPADSTLAVGATEAPEEPTPSRQRDVTPEFQVLGETTNTALRSSGNRSLRSSARRQARSTADRDVEVSESPAGKPGSGRRVRVSTERSENADATEAAARRLNDVVGTPTRTARGSAAGRSPSPTLTVQRPRERAGEREERDEDVDMDMDELTPDRPKTLRQSPRRSMLEEDVSLESVRESIESKDDDAEEDASPISDTEAAAALRRNRAPKASYVEKRPGVDDEDDEGSDRYEESVDEEAEADTLTVAQQRKRLAKVGRKKRRNDGNIASPATQKPARNKTAARAEAAAAAPADSFAPKKRGRPKGSKNSVKSGNAGRPKRQDMGSKSKETIAVQTYRLSVYNPPPELEAEADEDVEEVLTQPIPFAALPRSTGGVNSIDVLSQILNEVLQSALESLEQGAAQADQVVARRMTPEKVAERREYRTKLRAVEAWGEAAGGRLMEMGLALDAAVAMGRRVREVERERLELRERLAEVRRERERVGLRGDGVRGRHEREGAKREVDRRLQGAIEGIGVAVGVCREAGGGEGEGDEEMERGDVIKRLREAAEMVGSGTRDEGGAGEGLLDRLRRMNGLLERAAGALEGR